MTMTVEQAAQEWAGGGGPAPLCGGCRCEQGPVSCGCAGSGHEAAADHKERGDQGAPWGDEKGHSTDAFGPFRPVLWVTIPRRRAKVKLVGRGTRRVQMPSPPPAAPPPFFLAARFHLRSPAPLHCEEGTRGLERVVGYCMTHRPFRPKVAAQRLMNWRTCSGSPVPGPFRPFRCSRPIPRLSCRQIPHRARTPEN
jgi:hypothetical protein